MRRKPYQQAQVKRFFAYQAQFRIKGFKHPPATIRKHAQSLCASNIRRKHPISHCARTMTDQRTDGRGESEVYGGRMQRFGTVGGIAYGRYLNIADNLYGRLRHPRRIDLLSESTTMRPRRAAVGRVVSNDQRTRKEAGRMDRDTHSHVFFFFRRSRSLESNMLPAIPPRLRRASTIMVGWQKGGENTTMVL
ncbi:hypothetical protein C8F01DRAFT_1170839 [Mycena amicta]|nr:hypothetical protein C8F01DRAFT_1170839 [Mycena amicta]